MRLVQDDAKAARIVGELLDVELCPPFMGIVVMDDLPRIRGAVIFNDYTGANVEMTGAGRGCWTVPVIRDLARYCFEQLKVRRVTARTAISNATAIRALERMGFRREGVARQWFDGEDAILFGLLASEQRLVRRPR